MIRRTAVTLTLIAMLLVAGCARGVGDAETSPPETAPSPSSSSSTMTPSPTAFAGTEIVVSVVAGKVMPPTHRVEVAEGTDVRLLVTSDEADELHIHGFDIEQELIAGEQATVDFTADQSGVFEVETHESGLQLVQLEVR